MIVGLFVGIWITRYLGPNQFGLLSFTQSFVALFSTLASLGINNVVIRELAKDERNPGVLIGTSFLLLLIGSIITILVIYSSTQFLNYDSLTKNLILIVSLSIFFQSFNVIDFYFQSKVLSRYVVISNIIVLFFSSVLKIFLLLTKASLMAFAMVALFDGLVLVLGFCYFFYMSFDFLTNRIKFSFDVAKSLLKDSWSYIFSGVLVSIYMKIDQVMLKEILGDYAVGQYSAAIRLSEVWYFIPMVVCSSLLPAIVNAKKQDKSSYENRLSKLYALMVFAALIISVPLSFSSHFIVSFLYGRQYAEASGILMVHIWATVFVFIGVAGGKWLLVENLQMFSFFNTFVGALVNIALNLLWIPDYGGVGAAWATFFAQAFAAYFSMFFWKSTRANFYMLTRAIFMFPGYIFIKHRL